MPTKLPRCKNGTRRVGKDCVAKTGFVKQTGVFATAKTGFVKQTGVFATAKTGFVKQTGVFATAKTETHLRKTAKRKPKIMDTASEPHIIIPTSVKRGRPRNNVQITKITIYMDIKKDFIRVYVEYSGGRYQVSYISKSNSNSMDVMYMSEMPIAETSNNKTYLGETKSFKKFETGKAFIRKQGLVAPLTASDFYGKKTTIVLYDGKKEIGTYNYSRFKESHPEEFAFIQSKLQKILE